MEAREVRAAGLEYLELVTKLLRRVRLSDPEAGVYEFQRRGVGRALLTDGLDRLAKRGPAA